MNTFEKLDKALELLAEVAALLKSAKSDTDEESGPVKADDAGGSNPPGPGQPGKP